MKLIKNYMDNTKLKNMELRSKCFVAYEKESGQIEQYPVNQEAMHLHFYHKNQ